MIRNNKLKIYVTANEAKPGGNIGAMLSPYLFSSNMTDFCKKFNDLTKDYLTNVWIPVVLYTDVVEKLYTFFLKPIAISMFILDFFLENNVISIVFLYDLMKYLKIIYILTNYKMVVLILSILNGFFSRFQRIQIFESLKEKVNYVL